MKQIFDWMRKQINAEIKECQDFYLAQNNDSVCKCVMQGNVNAYAKSLSLIDEAEYKWEADCELLDKLITETPECRHGVCAFRHEEECVSYEDCESCLAFAIKDLLVNPNSRFKKICEVE